MKAATVKELKTELSKRPPGELLELCLRLSRFKKENKELLTYLLYESGNESGYIESVKREVDDQFDQINTKSLFYVKKSVRKILRIIKKYVRYSGKKETEAQLLLYFCEKLKTKGNYIQRNVALGNLYKRQVVAIEKVIEKLHEDLQYDYQEELKALK